METTIGAFDLKSAIKSTAALQRTAGRLPTRRLPVEQVWELSKLWYRDRLSPEFAGRSPEQAHQIIRTLGLTSNFWRFDA